MTREKARELPAVQAQTGGGYNRNAARLILAGVLREHGQPAVDGFIREFDLQQLFDFETGARFTGPDFSSDTETTLPTRRIM
jgi:hypothetical protein